MSVDPVSLSALLPALEAPPALAAARAPEAGFADMVSRGLEGVGATLARADSEVRQVAAGTGPALHEVMIHLEEARLSFQLLAQVRNRLLDAYQEVMRMQV